MADEPPFDIRYDAGDRILHMRLSGFWSPATLAAFAARLLMEVARLKLRRIHYRTLSDARAFEIQSNLVNIGFERIAKRGAELQDGRSAIVVGGQLSKLQAGRVMAAPNMRVFLDIEEARAWLLADEDSE